MAADSRLGLWNSTQADYPDLAIATRITARAAQTPDAVAVRAGTAALRYRDLERCANALASQLIVQGARPGQTVAVLLPRTTDLVTALLAVVKIGATYLPIDPEYPAERVSFVLGDSAAAVVLTTRALSAKAPHAGAALVCLDEFVFPESAPVVDLATASEDAFYLIYTSGSTGQPKGALVPQRGVRNQFHHYTEFLALDADARVLIFTSIGFDMTQCNIWATLMAGGCVVLQPPGVYDPRSILDTLERERVTHINCTPSAFLPVLEVAEGRQYQALASLRYLALGGESIPLSRLAAWRAKANCGCTLVNSYGPTECSAKVAMHKLEPGAAAPERLPVGKAIYNLQLHVLDTQLQPVAVGQEGELCVTGVGVGLGYLNRPELTAERFPANPFGPGRLYRTGDRARWTDAGVVEVLGRLDTQVKVRGVRLELGEVEAVLNQHPDVRESAAAVFDDRLCAYVVLRDGAIADAHALREALSRQLPEAMVPTVWTLLPRLPVNAHGKLDRLALQAPARTRPVLAQEYQSPQGALEIWLASQMGVLVGCDEVGRHDPFFELGGTSLSAVRLVAQASRKLGITLPVVGFFAAPTAAAYASALTSAHSAAVEKTFGVSAVSDEAERRRRAPKKRAASDEDDLIAVVGMAVRLPGADDVDAFWRNLVDGVESIRPVTDAELDAAGVSAELRQDPNFVRATATLDHPDCFDAAFFGYTPREAQLLDPQQRVLLECAHAALEHAGLDPARSGRHIGVFGGVARNSYFQHQLANNETVRALLPDVQVTFGNDKDYAATRVSFKLDLRGPAFTAQTACSTGGVLLHLARQSLRNRECDAAIVGGARIVCPLNAGYLWVDGSIMSRDGRMRAFDAQGTGMIRASGVSCVVLKRLADARRDGDTVYSVIRGSALNNDGADKAGYAAPSIGGQSEVIQLALDDAGLSADDIGYIEAHGTSTHLGDPIEITALTRAFRQQTARTAYCRIGSVKSNLGHLDPAAGVVSLIKTSLMLHHRSHVPSVGYETPNPNIDFASSPFVVADRYQPWESASPRRAGVSSFGIGGTNAHLVLEEAPGPARASVAARAWQIYPLSAKTDEVLLENARRHSQWWQRQTGASLIDAAWTLQLGRAAYEKRGIAVVQDARSLVDRALAEGFIKGAALRNPSLVFVFPGQGAQHPGMGRELYQYETVYRRVIDEGCEILKPLLKEDLRKVLYPDPDSAEAAAVRLKETVLAQPAIFLVSYALARLWDSWGIRPSLMIGHSVGEFVAATLAGVFEFADALKLLAARAKLMQSMPAGSMMAIRLPAAEVPPHLVDGVCIAAVNAPGLSIVSGPTESVDALESKLKDQGIGVLRLHTSHAFHSSMMDPIVEAFRAEVAGVVRKPPQREIISTLTAESLTAEQAQDPDYWSSQLRQEVRFLPAVSKALASPGRVFLEVGPGQSLSGPLRQIAAAHPNTPAAVVASAPPAGQENTSAAEQLMQAFGRLWMAGLPVDWSVLHEGPRCKVGLPTYAFARTRHWIEATAKTAVESRPALPAAAAVSVVPSVPDESGADAVREKAVAILSELTGFDFDPAEDGRSFLDLGMDSLLLTQVAGKLKNGFKVDLRFRQLLEDFNTLEKLLAYLRQKGTLSGSAGGPSAASAVDAAADDGKPKKAFGAAVRISKERDVLSPAQRYALNALITRYVTRTRKSKAHAQTHRAHFADPRTVSGFKPMWKESVYPIVSTRSEGAHVWDVDGNQYIDTVNGFGATMFGHKPPFIDAALREQIDRGYEVGPVQDFIGDCAQLFAQMVRLDRVAFCNTGSEAVSAAQRCARTATGRDLIASFAGDYHGIHDEVIVRPGPNGRGMPAAGGIPASHTANTLILEYGDPKSLEVLRARADELAAIMIEPIQSRNQGLQPREFIHQLREICTQAGCAFIMDEVITGFRIAQGGAQEFFGVKADLATYGKVFGGGMPVGALAGVPKFMDALDGGLWHFGDQSVPEAGVTYFAGTFVRHPLAMAATLATLRHLQQNPGIQQMLNDRVTRFVARLREALAALEAPVLVSTYTSIFRFEVSGDEPFGELLAHYFRMNGVHTYDHRNQIMTTSHTEEVMETMFHAYIGGVRQMQKDGLLGKVGAPVKLGLEDSRPGAIWYAPPLPDAKLGWDAEGRPAWFVPDHQRPGKYLEVRA